MGCDGQGTYAHETRRQRGSAGANRVRLAVLLRVPTHVLQHRVARSSKGYDVANRAAATQHSASAAWVVVLVWMEARTARLMCAAKMPKTLPARHTGTAALRRRPATLLHTHPPPTHTPQPPPE